jgi:hypothetical protein
VGESTHFSRYGGYVGPATAAMSFAINLEGTVSCVFPEISNERFHPRSIPPDDDEIEVPSEDAVERLHEDRSDNELQDSQGLADRVAPAPQRWPRTRNCSMA